MTRTERNYGIDFLRFVSMLMIVGLHVIGNGGILNNIQALTIKGEIVWFVEIAFYCSVNCFALISGYVGLNAKHKWKNIVSLSIQTLFYCLLFTLIYIGVTFFNNEKIDFLFVLKSLIPQLSARYWYFSAYFCLYFFMPILNAVVNMPKSFLKRAAVLIVVVFCGISQIQGKVSSLSDGYSFLWLAILYVVGGYLAKYKVGAKLSLWKNISGYIVCIAITWASRFFVYLLNGPEWAAMLLISYTSPTILLAALFLINAFSNIQIGEKYKSKVLLFASASFGVYLIHCQIYVHEKLLNNAFAKIAEHNVILLVLEIFAIIIAIYLICTVMEILRKKIFKLLKIEVLIDNISKIITRIFSFIEGNIPS